MTTRKREIGVLLLCATVLLAVGCARLEPVDDATELAVKPEPANPKTEEEQKEEKEGLKLEIDLEELIPIKLLLEEKPSSYLVDDVLKARAIGKDQDELRLMLSKIGSSRMLLLQLNSDLKARYYQGHDETIYVIKGHGIMIIGEDRYVAKPRAVFVIPRNVVFSFINTGEKPFVALVVQSPTPLGGDMVFVRPKKEE